MIAQAVIEDALHGWFCWASGVVGAKAIWANQGDVRPKLPYCTLNLIVPWKAYGNGPEMILPEHDSPSDMVYYEGQGHMTLSLRGYGEDSYASLLLAERSLTNAQLWEYLKKSQIVTYTVATVAAGAYTVTIEGHAVTYTAALGATALTIRNGLVAAINANTWLAAIHLTAAAVVGSNADFTVTGRAGQEFLSAITANLTAAVSQYPVDLAYIENMGLNAVPLPRDTHFEDSWNLDIRFATTQRVVHDDFADEVSFIEHVNITDETTGATFTVDE